MEQELGGLIPPPHAIRCRVDLRPYVPLAFHGYLHHVQGHGEGRLSCQEGERTAVRRTTGPAHPVGAGAAQAKFVMCDESIEQDH